MGKPATEHLTLIRTRDQAVQMVRVRGARRAVAAHAHASLVLALVLAGTRTCQTARGDLCAGPGQVLVVEPGLVHACRMSPGGCDALVLCLDPDRAAALLARHGDPARAMRTRTTDCPELARALRDLAQALGLPDPDAPSPAPDRGRGQDPDPVLRQAMAALARAPGPGLPRSPAADAGRRRVRAFLDAPAQAPLPDPARTPGLSPDRRSRLITRAMGVPPRTLAAWRRVRRAREYLDQGLPLADCAALAGFADQSHMTRHFTRLLGLTPGQYAAARQT